MSSLSSLRERASHAWFRLIHRSNLVYNACWEDPRLDIAAMEPGPDDRILVITSAGCNALEYVIAGAGHVSAVDINPIQNALLELKLSGIRALAYDDFFDIFGRGRSSRWHELYNDVLQHDLPPSIRRFWASRSALFNGESRRRSFYFHGSAGLFAWIVNQHINRQPGMRDVMNLLLNAASLSEQRALFDQHQVAKRLITPLIRWFLKRDTALAMLGVPRAQRRQLDENYPGGIVAFIEDRLTEVLTAVPLVDNYFWRVYLTGEYTPDCCPGYLTRDGFHFLKNGAVDRVTTHTATVSGLLQQYQATYTRFVLLDHMDWLWSTAPQALADEWQAILHAAAPGARCLWRSAGFSMEFLNRLPVRDSGRTVGDHLQYHPDVSAGLHARDRVRTYGSFWVADILPE